MLSILKSALNANTKEMGIVSNNIANVNSTAFKKSKTNFEHIYSRDRSSSPSKFSGQGVAVNDPLLQMSQGSLKTTNGALDLAITGLGFFTVVHEETLETPFFTRDGSFQLDREGNLVNTDGLPLLGIGQAPINIPFLGAATEENGNPELLTEISVDSEGEISATYGLDSIVKVGQIELADFVNEHGLKNIGNARFNETPESGVPTFGAPKERTIGKIQAGFLEKSNTDITDEIILMLRTQQAFNGCGKMLQSEIDVTKTLSAR